MTIIVALFLSRHALEREWLLPRSSVRYPSAGVKTHGAESEFWGEELFDDMFRFRRMHFLRMMDGMGLRNKTIIIFILSKQKLATEDVCWEKVIPICAFLCAQSAALRCRSMSHASIELGLPSGSKMLPRAQQP